MKRSALLLAGCGLLALTGGEFSPGGVTFPMEQISAERYEVRKSASPNLLGEDLKRWQGSLWVFGSKEDKAKKAAARKIVSLKIVNADGREALELNRPAALEELMQDRTRKLSASFSQVIKLPDSEGGNYRLSFKSRNQTVGEKGFAQLVIYSFRDGSDPRPGRGKPTRRGIVNRISSNPQWSPYSYEFSVPPKTRDLGLTIRCDGCGLFQARDLKLEKIAAKTAAVTVELSPMKLLDNTYFLASDTPGIIGFRFKNNLPSGKLAQGNGYRFSIELPESVKLLECNARLGTKIEQQPFTLHGKNYVRYTVDCSRMIALVRNRQGFNGWNIPCMLLEGSGKPGERFECFFFVSDKGKLISDKNSFTLQFMEKLPRIAAPKHFLTGFCAVPADVEFDQNGEKLGRFFADRGVNIAVGSWNKGYRDKLRKGGIPLLTAQCYPISNGFRIGLVAEKDRPADSIFRDADGKPVIRHNIVSTCPYAVYSKGEYYTKFIVPLVKKVLSSGGADGLQPNWEPWWWRSRGCFCDNCRGEFAKFSKMPLDEVKKVWPKQFLLGGKMHASAIKFRGWQHGQLIRTLNELTLANGAKMGFFPEVGTSQIVRGPNYQTAQGEFSPYEYADKLQWLNVWGPYIFFVADQPYSYIKGAHLYFYLQSLRVFRDYGATFPDKAKRAKVMAMPHGNQGDMCWLGQPEGMAMDQLSAFLTGFRSSVLYFFPRCYDHRYWKAVAESNAEIARNEELVLNGKPYPDVSVRALTPFASETQFSSRGLNGEFGLLQAIAFKKEDKILVAVGNFWEKGDVVFELRVPGLPENKRLTVREKAFGRHFTADGGSFTGGDLARGIKLHVGAVRWAFFEITPEFKAPGEAVTASRMDEIRKSVAARTAKAAELEAQRDKISRAENDCGQLKDCAFGPLKCRAVNGRLEIVSGENRAVIDPKGMSLASWIVNGTEQSANKNALAGFWTPGKKGFQCSRMFRITDEKADADGLTVTGVMTITAGSFPQLSGLEIRKTFRFSSDLKKLTITAELKNPAEVEMSGIGFRWSLFPAAWNNRLAGKISVAGKTFPRFRRQALLAGSIAPGCEDTLRRIFRVKAPTDRIRGNTFLFEDKAGNKCSCTVLPEKLFGGACVWDAYDMLGATFEPFYQEIDIGPGAKAVFQLKLDFTSGGNGR